MKRTISAITGVMAAVCFAVDYAGPGGDMAAPANWGGTLPDNATAVSFGPSAVPSTGLTLSDHVAFGATTIAAGFADGLLFDLAGYSYTGAGLTVKSDTTFQDGFFTNTALAVAADTTLTLSGADGDCELRLTGASTPFSSGATLHVTDGATFRPGGTGFNTTASDTTILFDEGATLDCTGMTSEYNIAFLFRSVANVNLIADNATMKFYTLNAGGKSNGTLGMVRNSLFSFRNGSTVTFSNHSNGMNTRGFYLGSSGDNARSNLLEVISSSFRIAAESSLHLHGRYNAVVVSNSTFNAKVETHASGCCNTILYDRSAVSGAISVYGTSNKVDVVYCPSFPALTLGGFGNTATFISTNSSTVTLGGSNNVVRLLNGGRMTARPSVSGIGQKTFDVCGGDVYSTSMTIAGTNFSYVIRDGGTLTFGNGTSVNKNNFNFTPKASSNAVLRIQDGGTVTIKAIVNFTGNEAYAYNWTNCPACAIEFSGASPLMVFNTYSANYEVLGLGTPDEGPLSDPVALRYLIPDGGWASAPLQNTGSRRMWIYGNQPIEVEMESGAMPKTTMRVPLIYDNANFNASVNNGPRMTAARLSMLNANAKLPEGASLYYDSSAKTLGVLIPGSRRLIIIFR